MSYLQSLVVHKIKEIGHAKAAELFSVSTQLVKQWENGSKAISLAAVERVFEIPEQKSIEASWEGKRVLLMLPWYKQTNPLTAFSLLALLNREKMGVAMEFGDAFIAHARNVLLDRLVSTGIEWGCMIDDDMIVPMGNAGWFKSKTGMDIPDTFAGKHTLNQLLSHNKSLVGGLYFGRNSRGRAMYYEALVANPAGEEENRYAHLGPREELRPVKWTATGCLLIHRQVALDIREQMPWLAPLHPTEPWQYFSNASDGLLKEFTTVRDETAKVHQEVLAGQRTLESVEKFLGDTRRRLDEAMMSVQADNRLQSGEDAIFGIRAFKCGHQSYVDMSVVCAHVGGAIYGPHNTLRS
jgi:hypothetical protein